LLLQREIPDEVNIRGSHLAKEYGVQVVLDMGGADAPLSSELLSLIKIISPNKTELRRILKRDINFKDNDKLIEALEEMRTISNNKELCLLLKLGSKGSLYIDEQNKIYKQSAYSFDDMPILDTTGAGDCFTASFATQLVDGKSIEKALIFASASAFVAITRIGAMPSLPSKEDVEKILARIEA
jgi:ribokinase